MVKKVKYSGNFARNIYYKKEISAEKLLQAALSALPATTSATDIANEAMDIVTPNSTGQTNDVLKSLHTIAEFHAKNPGVLSEVAANMNLPRANLLRECDKLSAKIDDRIKPLETDLRATDDALEKLDPIKDAQKITALQNKIIGLNVAIDRLDTQKKELGKVEIGKNPATNHASMAVATTTLDTATQSLSSHDEREKQIERGNKIRTEYNTELRNLERIKSEIQKDVTALQAQQAQPNADQANLPKRIEQRVNSIKVIDASIAELKDAKKSIPQPSEVRNAADKNALTQFSGRHAKAENTLDLHITKNSIDQTRDAIRSISPDLITSLDQVCVANQNNIAHLTLNAFAANVSALNTAEQELKTIADRRRADPTSEAYKKEYDAAVKKLDDCCAVVANQLNPDRSLLYTSDNAKGTQQIIADAFNRQDKKGDLEKLTRQLHDIDDRNMDDEWKMRLAQKIGGKLAGAAKTAGISDTFIHQFGSTRNKIPVIGENFTIDSSMGSDKKSSFTVYDYDPYAGTSTPRKLDIHLTKQEMKIAIERYNTKQLEKDPDFKPIHQGTPWPKFWKTRTYCGTKAHRDGLIKEMELVQEERNKLAKGAAAALTIASAPTPPVVDPSKPTPNPGVETDIKNKLEEIATHEKAANFNVADANGVPLGADPDAALGLPDKDEETLGA